MTSVIMIAPLNAANFETGNASEGQVLTSNGAGGAAFEDAAGGVPSVVGASDGDVLTIGSGVAAWQAPVGGSADSDWLIGAASGRHTPDSTAGGLYSFAAGRANTASGSYATVGGGTYNTASGESAIVAGGKYNTASNSKATVGGGMYNTASNIFATVVGGASNLASGQRATIVGGTSGIASGAYSVILGGVSNNTNNLSHAMIVGSNITASLANALHCNQLVVTQIPVASAGLPSGAVWSDSGTLKIVS